MDANADHPLTSQSDDDYLSADATDRRVALEQATVAYAAEVRQGRAGFDIRIVAQDMYVWLRQRPSIVPVKLVLRHGRVREHSSAEH
jgi:hypothetical protein